MCQQKTKGRLEEWMRKIDKTMRGFGSVSKSMSCRNPTKEPAKILTGPNMFVILGDKT